MVTSLIDYKVLEWDENPQTKTLPPDFYYVIQYQNDLKGPFHTLLYTFDINNSIFLCTS